MIIDDDHSGMFVFDNDEKTVVESDRLIEIKILRTSGARGRVRVPYTTEDETALHERDYISNTGEVIFENNENEYVLIRSYRTYVGLISLFPVKENNRKRISSCSLILLKAFLFFSVLYLMRIRLARLANIMSIKRYCSNIDRLIALLPEDKLSFWFTYVSVCFPSALVKEKKRINVEHPCCLFVERRSQ
jgi:hypothetical protein